MAEQGRPHFPEGYRTPPQRGGIKLNVPTGPHPRTEEQTIIRKPLDGFDRHRAGQKAGAVAEPPTITKPTDLPIPTKITTEEAPTIVEEVVTSSPSTKIGSTPQEEIRGVTREEAEELNKKRIKGKPKKGLSTGQKVGLGLGTLTVLGGLPQAIPVVRSAEADFLRNIRGDNLQADNAQVINTGSLGPQQTNESVSWWRELPEKEIQSLAQIPSINIIGNEHESAVSPSLQQLARDAGYGIIYQGDPNDTTGRTVITKGRQTSNRDWTVEDQGFGRAGLTVRGIFKAWVPDPEDPTQKSHVYVLLINPISKEETSVRLELQPFDPNSPIRPTWFTIDDLYNGPSEIARRSKEVGRQPGQELTTDGLPSPSDPPLQQSKKLTDFPTLDGLLRKEALSLTNLAMPGDYVIIVMQTAGVDEVRGDYRYKKDENGVSRAITFGIRRFGGEKQWKSEISASAK